MLVKTIQINHPFFLHIASILLLFSLSLVNFASSFSFHFDNFKDKAVSSETNPRGNLVSLQRDASVDASGVIHLTASRLFDSQLLSIGRAVYSEPMRLWDNKIGEIANFTTEFSFFVDVLDRNISTCGDGFAFFLAPYPSIIPHGSGGGRLGLISNGGNDALGDNMFVAVEFDTYVNERWDPMYPHVGINVNSMTSKKVFNISSKFIKGSGYKGKARVSYNANKHSLSAFWFDDDGKSPYDSPILSYVVDLSKVLPEIVTFGFSAATGYSYELNRIKSWSFTSTMDIVGEMKPNQTTPTANITDKNNNDFAKGNNTIWFIVSMVLACGMVVFFISLVVVWYLCFNRKKRCEDQNYPQTFPYVELERATGNFAEGKKLGEGGSGVVYEGFIDDGRSNLHVAIKRISKDSNQATKEYLSEVNIISRLSHRNLVKLLGYCQEEKELLVVYQFLPNGSLDLHLFNPKNLLSWLQRHKILVGLASAVLYLHESCEQYVVHRDIKSSNILLDESFEAKLGDFGLARLVEHEHSMRTTIVAGTRGYMAPECIYSGKFSKESDVYAFGIVALEIACGKKCINDKNADENAESTPVLLTERVWEMFGKQKLLEVVDQRLDGQFDKEQVERALMVGLWCSQPDFHNRPSIRQASAVLNFDIPMPKLPINFPSISNDAIIRNMSSIPSSSTSQLFV